MSCCYYLLSILLITSIIIIIIQQLNAFQIITSSSSSNNKILTTTKTTTFKTISNTIIKRQQRQTIKLYATTLQKQNNYNINNNNNNFQIGDQVIIINNNDNNNNNTVLGIIEEIRGRGWYNVKIIINDDSTTTITNVANIGKHNNNNNRENNNNNDNNSNNLFKKFRSSQLMLLQKTSSSSSSVSSSSSLEGGSSIKRKIQQQQQEQDFVQQQQPIIIHDLDNLLQLDKQTTTKQEEQQQQQQLIQKQQLQCFNTYNKWIIFSDLHCSILTIEICIEILQYIHTVAVQKNAGIIFLGDFWHIRSSSININCLNQILNIFNKFTQPFIFITGNHDQLTYQLSNNHSIQPLQYSYNINYNNNTNNNITTKVPGVLICTYPIKFLNALFIPYIRNTKILHNVLQQQSTNTTTTAIFCHVDVTGASMNDNIISNGGISPTIFPPNIPIYTGHFHKPHNVTTNKNIDNDNQKTKTTTIQYVGSPYQISLSEAGQNKSILLLDRTKNWTCIERIPINFGRKHYKPNTINEFLSLQCCTNGDDNDEVDVTTKEKGNNKVLLKKGDRVVFTMDKNLLDDMRQQKQQQNVVDIHANYLRTFGITVEIRQIKDNINNNNNNQMLIRNNNIDPSINDNNNNSLISIDDLSNEKLWDAFLYDEMNRGIISDNKRTILLQYGLNIIEELYFDDTSSKRITMKQNNNNLHLHSVTIEGFGPFHKKITYPLFDRGLVLICGKNKDDGSDSNGTGKTSLAVSILWALTGSIDTRPVQDTKVADVVNDNSKGATVTVKGILNDVQFEITRSKTASSGSLHFNYGGNDHTALSIKETQDRINEKLGLSPQILSRTIFHGQHSSNELLEASDTKLKEELSLVTDLSLWEAAVGVAKRNAKNSSKRISELDGILSIWSEEIKVRKEEYDEAKNEYSLLEKSAAEQAHQQYVGECDNNVEYTTDRRPLAEIENELSDVEVTIRESESKKIQLSEDRNKDLASLYIEFERKVSDITEHYNAEKLEREINNLSYELWLTEAKITSFENLWNVSLADEISNSINIPDACPTCRQSLTNVGFDIQKDIVHNGSALIAKRDHLTKDLQLRKNDLELCQSKREALEQSNENDMNHARECWESQLIDIDRAILVARQQQRLLAAEVFSRAKQVEIESEIQSRKAKTELIKERLRQAKEAFKKSQLALTDMERKFKEAEVERAEMASKMQTMLDLAEAFGRRGVQTYLLKSAVSTLEYSCQYYLDLLSEGVQRLELTLDSGVKILRRAFVAGADGVFKDRPLGSLSGGQWRRCSLALNLAFAELVVKRTHFRPSLFVFDEPLTHLDQSGRADAGRVLRGLLRRSTESDSDASGDLQVSTILIILQDLAAEELEQHFDEVDEVVKENGTSTVSFGYG